MESNYVYESKEASYNKDPVYYCKCCLSLKIRALGDEEFCEDCGAMDIATTSIEEWEKMYEEKYGHKFIIKNGRLKKYLE